MKIVLFAFVFIFSVHLYAQNELKKKHVFVRVYDLKGEKFSRGRLLGIDANSILIKRGQKAISIDVSDIKTIKTKRAFGNNLGLGTLAGATMGILYSFTRDPADIGVNTGTDNAAVFGVPGLILGSIVGGLTAIGKKSKSFEINQDPEQLLKFKESMNRAKLDEDFDEQ